MNGTESDLMRLLHGELPEAQARELRARLLRDPVLHAEYDRLRRTWEALVLPPPAPVPPDFTRRVMAHALAERPAGGLSLRGAPVWVRAVAAVALVAGTAIGIGLGGRLPLGDDNPAVVQTARTDETARSEDLLGDSLAGSYWDTLEGLE